MKKSEAKEQPESPDESEKKSESENMGIPGVRQECLKLAHSALKSVDEILADAAVYTAWVLTGESKPK